MHKYTLSLNSRQFLLHKIITNISITTISRVRFVNRVQKNDRKSNLSSKIEQHHVLMRTIHVVLYKYYSLDPQSDDINAQHDHKSNKLHFLNKLPITQNNQSRRTQQLT